MVKFDNKVKNYFTVSTLTGVIKRKLTSQDLQQIWVLGEITDLKSFVKGKHAYFSLKDENSILNCAFFAGNNRFFRGNLENGMKVFAFGSIDVYAPRGSYQLIVRQIIPAGEGEFALKIKGLEEKLKKEGLFDRKRPVPELPEVIGLITSKEGAAIKDFLKMATEVPYLKIIFFPALVQGEDAPATIIEGIKVLNEIEEVEVIVITRGGGSEEDLMCFYDEQLVRAIYNSKKPVISAIGHERDVVFTDRVADLRKATPTDAGKFFAEAYKKTFQNFRKLSLLLNRKMSMWVDRSPEMEKLRSFVSNLMLLSDSILNTRQQRIDSLKEMLLRNSEFSLREKEKRLNTLSIKIHPETLLREFETRNERLLNLKTALKVNIQNSLYKKMTNLNELRKTLKFVSPIRLKECSASFQEIKGKLNAKIILTDIEKRKNKIFYLKDSIEKEIVLYLREKGNLIGRLSEKLNDLSPLNTVSRGYAIVKDKKGNIVKSTKNVAKGDFVEINLKDGVLDCNVRNIKPKQGSSYGKV